MFFHVYLHLCLRFVAGGDGPAGELPGERGSRVLGPHVQAQEGEDRPRGEPQGVRYA